MVPRTDDDVRRDLCKAGRRLHELGHTPATSGNLSVRLDPWRIMITPTGVSKGDMAPEDMVVISPEGLHRFGRKRASSETPMHLMVYKLRPDVGAVVHAHPVKATSFACAGLSLSRPLSSEVVMGVGKIPLAKYGAPGTNELAESMKHLIPDHNAILMGNHGAVTYGKTLFDARGRLEVVEHYAEIVLGTYALGRQTVLDAAELRKLDEMIRKYTTSTTKWD